MTKRSKRARLKDKAWDLCSEYVRRSYADDNGYVACYTCDVVKQWKGEGMSAGHGIAGRGGFVLFLLEVIRPQCSQCNLNPPYGRGGHYQVFVPKLIREYGQDQYEAWERESKKPCKVDYQSVIDDLTEKLAELEG